MNYARFKAIHHGMTAVAKKVYEAVPMSEAWSHSQIHTEIHRLGYGVQYNIMSGGVYSTEALATEAAIALIKAERDSHHTYSIAPFTLDATPDFKYGAPTESEPSATVHRSSNVVRAIKTRKPGEWITDGPPWWQDFGRVIEVETPTGNIIGRVEIPPWQDQDADTPGIRLITDTWERAEFPPGARWRYFDGPTSHHI